MKRYSDNDNGKMVTVKSNIKSPSTEFVEVKNS